jgi:hypothetical protein
MDMRRALELIRSDLGGAKPHQPMALQARRKSFIPTPA